MNIPQNCKSRFVICVVHVAICVNPALAITLVDTTAMVMDSNHMQVETAGGTQSHLLRVVTSPTLISSAIDADVLLADGKPLVMTWRRDAGDSDILTLSIAAVVDYDPQHLELSLRRNGGSPPQFLLVGTVSQEGTTANTSSNRTDTCFVDTINPETDLYIGDVPEGVAILDVVDPWTIDVSSVPLGETFDIVLRAAAPADGDYDDDVDSADYEQFHDCLESTEISDQCILTFDLDASGSMDLHDFALFQTLFTGTDVAAHCGGTD